MPITPPLAQTPTRHAVLVVGAGVLGLSVAAELTARGRRVLVLDARTGANASRVAAGMLAPAFESALEDASPPRAALYREARDLWPAFAERCGIALDRSGATWRGPREPLAGRLASLGFTAAAIDQGLFSAEDWRLDPPEALAQLETYVRAHGGRVEAAKVDSVEPDPQGVRVSAGDRVELAAAVVLAAGWAVGAVAAPRLEATLARILPIKGHILRLAGQGVDGVHGLVRTPDGYLVPRGEAVLAGATMQAGRSDLDVEASEVERLRQGAVAAIPGLAAAQVVESLTGVRGASPDGLPLAGPSRLAGVHLALAPRRNGWLLAPLVAQTVAAGLLGESDPAEGAFAPHRFEAG